jgi:hypothetical protein
VFPAFQFGAAVSGIVIHDLAFQAGSKIQNKTPSA